MSDNKNMFSSNVKSFSQSPFKQFIEQKCKKILGPGNARLKGGSRKVEELEHMTLHL